MLSQGFDFIILDYKHGNDLMERNALTLVSLLERLYQEYGSTFEQDITLIGPSMGSEVAQYALAYMEHNNIPHHVKTYISFDGPQQGANVPIGLQNMVEYLTKRGLLSKLKSTKSLIRNGLYNGLAARQLLAHHVSANAQFPTPDILRTKFLNNLQAVGEYPVLCRKVALINGMSNGTLNPDHLTPNESLLHIINKRRGWKSLWGACNWNVCKNLDWEAKAAPSIGTARISDMWTLNAVLNLIFWVPPFETSKSASAAWGNSSQDNAPGSIFGPMFGTLPGNVNEDKIKFLAKELFYLLTGSKRTTFTQNINNFSFISSYSSADLRFPSMTDNSDKNLYMDWSQTNLCGHTPFDYVYAPTDRNQVHVEVSQEGSEWFENEAKYPTGDLPVLFDRFITGDANLCSSSNYLVQSCKPSSMTINWSVSPLGIVDLSCYDCSQPILTRLNNGTVTLTAKVFFAGNNNPFTTITKTIYVGLPYITQNAGTGSFTPYPDDLEPGEEPPVNQICTGQQISMNVNVERASHVSWSRTFANPSNTTWSQSGNSLSFYLWGNDQQATFRASASNSCGVAQESFAFKSIGCGGDPGDPDPCNQFAVSPNPAKNNINIYVLNIPPPCDDPPIVISKSGQIGSSRGITQVKLFDNLGNLKKQQTTAKTTQTSLNISGLTPGIYYLEISNGAYKERQKVVIQ